MKESVLFNRYGKSIYRLCGRVFYDYFGKPRGFLVGRTVYDLHGQHRGFFIEELMRDRMGRVVGFTCNACADGLPLPSPEIPPVPYQNLAAPECPPELVERPVPALAPAWSIMKLDNLLV